MECQSKWKETPNGVSLKWNVTQLECHLNAMSLKMECQLNWNFKQNGMSLKMKYHIKCNFT